MPFKAGRGRGYWEIHWRKREREKAPLVGMEAAHTQTNEPASKICRMSWGSS